MKKLLLSLSVSLLAIAAIAGLMLRRPDGAPPAFDPLVETHGGEAATRGGAAHDAAAGRSAAPAAPSGADPLVPEPAASPDAVLRGTVRGIGAGGLAGAEVLVLAAPDPADLAGREFEAERLLRGRLMEAGPRPARRGPVAAATTGADGSYSLPLAAIPPGSYTVLARHIRHAPAAQTWTREPAPETLPIEMDFQLGPGETIEGLVQDPEGRPVAGSSVACLRGVAARRDAGGSPVELSVDSRGLVDLCRTGEDGRFHLAVPPGTFDIQASAPGYMPRRMEDVSSRIEGLLVLILPPSGRLFVRAAAAGGGPLPGVRLRLYAGEGGLPGEGGRPGETERALKTQRTALASGETDGEGSFLFTDVPVESFIALAEKPGFVPASVRGELDGTGSAGAAQVLLEAAAALSGSVRDVDGKPVAGAWVAVRAAEGAANDTRQARRAVQEDDEPQAIPAAKADRGAETDARGEFQIDTLPKGTYALSVLSDNHAIHRQDGIQLEDAARLEIVLQAGIRLEGKIIDAGGRPLPGAVVAVRRGGSERRSGAADAEGRYSVGGLFPGRMDLATVSAPGCSTELFDDVTLEPAPAVQSRDFRLAPASVVSGSVVDARGMPVADAQVWLVPVIDRVKDPAAREGRSRNRALRSIQPDQVRTDAAGAFIFAEVRTSGQAQLVITHFDFKPLRSEALAIEPGSRLEGLRFQLSAGGRLVVWVRDVSGAAVPQAAVHLVRRNPPAKTPASPEADKGRAGQGAADAGGSKPAADKAGTTFTTRQTGPDGMAVFGGIDGGEFDMTCAPKGYQRFAERTTIIEEQESREFIELLPENAILGTVTDSAGVPVAGADIVAARQVRDLPPEKSTTRAGADGAFRVGSLGEGAYTLSVKCRGFAERRLESIEANTSVQVVLEKLGAIRGWVQRADDRSPVAAFELRLLPSLEESGVGGGPRPAVSGSEGGSGPKGVAGDADAGRLPRRTIKDPGGLFDLNDIAPGYYRLRIAAAGFSTRELEIQVVEGLATEGLEILLDKGIVLQGTVLDARSRLPVPGAEIYLLSLRDDADGGGKGGGSSPGPGQGRRTDGASEPSPAPGIERARPQGRGPAIARAGEGGGGGNSIEETSASRAAYRQARALGAPKARADDNGFFEIRDILPGNYLLSFRQEAYVPLRQGLVVTPEGGAPELTVLLDPGRTLRGKITYSSGSRAVGVFVRLRDSEGEYKTAVTDSIGEYNFSGLSPGSHSFSVRYGEDSRTGSRQITIDPNRSNTFDYKIGGEERGR